MEKSCLMVLTYQTPTFKITYGEVAFKWYLRIKPRSFFKTEKSCLWYLRTKPDFPKYLMEKSPSLVEGARLEIA